MKAALDHAPVLALSGDMPRKMHGTDFVQTTEPDLLFLLFLLFPDVSLYTKACSPQRWRRPSFIRRFRLPTRAAAYNTSTHLLAASDSPAEHLAIARRDGYLEAGSAQ